MSSKIFIPLFFIGFLIAGTVRAEEPATNATVYVTRSGKSYHHADCRYLSWSKKAISLAQAKRRYKPCSYCAEKTLVLATPQLARGGN